MLSGGDSKKDGRAEPKAKERAEAELRNPRQRMEEGCGFLQPKRMHAKSQTLPDLPRRLGAPRQRALRRGSRITPKKHSTTAGGTTLSLCPFPAGRQAVAAASSHPHALRACSSFESLRPFGSRLSHVASGNHKNTHNTRTHPRRIARQHAEAGRRSTRGSMRREVKARPKGVRSRRITPALQKREIIFWSF